MVYPLYHGFNNYRDKLLGVGKRREQVNDGCKGRKEGNVLDVIIFYPQHFCWRMRKKKKLGWGTTCDVPSPTWGGHA